jgi:hypothetical protein
MYIALFILFTAGFAGVTLLVMRLRALSAAHRVLSSEHAALKQRFADIVDVDAEKKRILGEIDAARVNLQADVAQAEVAKRRILEEAASERDQAARQLEAEGQRRRGELEAERTQLRSDIARIQEERQRVQEDLQSLRHTSAAEKFNLALDISKLRADLKALDEEANLQSFGYYQPRYAFASSERYQQALEEIRERQKSMLLSKQAAVCRIEWEVNGSRVQGRKQTNHTLRLILRAFNGECDAAIAKVKYNNVGVMATRIRKAYEAINGLVQVQQAEISRAYLQLKLDELHLVHEHQEKLQEEKEEQRRIREQMREEELAQRELERTRTEAEREEKRYADALRKATEEAERAVGDKQQRLLGQVEELQRLLNEAQTNKERAIARAQMTRSGHVYVISNLGSFGEGVFKIGMTRRLDPMDRVRELGDASVPFQFDVHAIIYSDDAPALENKLHRDFHLRRVNRVNLRREFFRASIEEIAEAVHRHHGDIEFTLAAEAVEYRKTLAMVQDGQVPLCADSPSRVVAEESSARSTSLVAAQDVSVG